MTDMFVKYLSIVELLRAVLKVLRSLSLDGEQLAAAQRTLESRGIPGTATTLFARVSNPTYTRFLDATNERDADALIFAVAQFGFELSIAFEAHLGDAGRELRDATEPIMALELARRVDRHESETALTELETRIAKKMRSEAIIFVKLIADLSAAMMKELASLNEARFALRDQFAALPDAVSLLEETKEGHALKSGLEGSGPVIQLAQEWLLTTALLWGSSMELIETESLDSREQASSFAATFAALEKDTCIIYFCARAVAWTEIKDDIFQIFEDIKFCRNAYFEFFCGE